jgi:hypothetical protein
MDMLATCITIRSTKQNPTNKIIGYQMKHKAANQHKGKLKTTSQQTSNNQPPYDKLQTVITAVLVYCFYHGNNNRQLRRYARPN